MSIFVVVCWLVIVQLIDNIVSFSPGLLLMIKRCVQVNVKNRKKWFNKGNPPSQSWFPSSSADVVHLVGQRKYRLLLPRNITITTEVIINDLVVLKPQLKEYNAHSRTANITKAAVHDLVVGPPHQISISSHLFLPLMTTLYFKIGVVNSSLPNYKISSEVGQKNFQIVEGVICH